MGLVVECYQAHFLVCAAGRGSDRREWASHVLGGLIAQDVTADSGAVSKDANQDIHDDRIDRLIVPNFGEENHNRAKRQEKHQKNPEHLGQTAIGEKLLHNCTSYEKVVHVERDLCIHLAERKNNWK